ncbi:hypothetical protein GALMADRAFT_253725 [Galerina marginata CBS 339.88]|uniref:DUF6534 domain-containing protein n=1 Tax=Galerina marginata (strain CBS 339.88) TaxID=685588 RepID=A0A067SLZ4_GALM3|nr:hypothetical protein GALMADRAFT_253725 [Galerina marginata CBS 339.88]
MSALTPADLGRIAGPLLVGYILNWGLFGVLSMQVYLYYLAFPQDRVTHKLLVYGSFMLEATQTFLFTTSAFRTFATGFGNPAVLDEVDIIWFSVPIMSGIVGFITQAFYAYRVSVLAQSKYVAGLIMVLAFLQVAGSILIAVEAKKAAHWSLFLKRDSFISAGIWEGGSAACDVLIAASMTYYLKRRDTGVKQTQVLLSRLIRLTVETGTLTAAIAITTLILTFLPGRPTYYQASVSVLGKMYSNSMMVAFNSRMKIASPSGTSTSHEVSISLGQVHRTRPDMDSDITRSHGVLVTREQVSKISSQDKKTNDNLYSVAPFSA